MPDITPQETLLTIISPLIAMGIALLALATAIGIVLWEGLGRKGA